MEKYLKYKQKYVNRIVGGAAPVEDPNDDEKVQNNNEKEGNITEHIQLLNLRIISLRQELSKLENELFTLEKQYADKIKRIKDYIEKTLSDNGITNPVVIVEIPCSLVNAGPQTILGIQLKVGEDIILDKKMAQEKEGYIEGYLELIWPCMHTYKLPRYYVSSSQRACEELLDSLYFRYIADGDNYYYGKIINTQLDIDAILDSIPT
jgi:hypothetical protein